MKALILTGHGLNCAREMALGFQLVGAHPHIVHLNDLPQITLLDYDILVLPGGFSFGDHLGSGRALSQRLLRAPLGQAIERFVEAGKLVWGVCNGFQTLVQMGLLPGPCTLASNESGRFECRWVRLAVNPTSPCRFTRGLTHLELPVRHGEGRLLGSPPPDCVPLHYVDPQGQPTQEYPYNPNGSPLGAAALCDASGRIFGLMPHPEAFLRWTQHPNWTQQREHFRRQGLSCPTEGQGLSLFRAALN
jgi:phosphoribosylformylglycinamidine synthase